MTPRRLQSILRGFAKARLLVVGDVMLDQFVWGRVDRISPEAPVPVVEVTHETVHLGGAANVAHNVAALGGKVGVAGAIGQDPSGKRTLGALDALGVAHTGLVRSREVATVRKTRVIAHNQQVVRFDREQKDLPEAVNQSLRSYLRRNASRFDAIIVSDYGKGVITPDLLDDLAERRAAKGGLLIVDPKKRNYGHYRGITLATPNASEASDAAGIDVGASAANLRSAGKKLIEMWDADAMLITRGEHGMSLMRPGKSPKNFPTTSRQVYDVTGAGDTVVATCALALAAGATLEEAALLSNHAAGVVVAKLGTATVSAAELRATFRTQRD